LHLILRAKQAEQIAGVGFAAHEEAIRLHPVERVRPAKSFRELSHPGDDLALVPALVLGLDRDLRGWHGSHGDYFRH
jgi:hypothetical protein